MNDNFNLITQESWSARFNLPQTEIESQIPKLT